MRVAQILRDLLERHHAGALVGERGFLSGFRFELGQFIHRVTQVVRLAARLLDARTVHRHGVFGRTARRPRARYRRRVILQPRIGIQKPAVRRHIDQRALVVLAVYFHQRGA